MIIHIRKLEECESHPIQHSYDAKELEAEFDDLKYLKKVELTGTAERYTDSLRVQGILTGEIEQTCGRCLKKEINLLKKKIDLFFDTKDIETVDIEPDIRELLILEHPISYRCHEGDKGSCGESSEHLAKDDDVWKGEKPNPFSDLKQLFNRRKKEN